MSNGGKRLKELLKKHGYTVEYVAGGIGITSRAIRGWKDTAPLDRLFEISDLTHIPVIDLVECFRPAPGAIDPNQSGGDEN
jgi:transcriptional regulator with XRE-family HTH domain